MTLTTAWRMGFKKGDLCLISKRRYRVVQVLSPTSVRIRRTFWQWVSDLFRGRPT